MSNLRVNIISPYTGSKVTIIGFSATGSLEGTSSYANFSTSASYVDGYTTLPEFNAFTSSYVTDSGSFDSRISAQESFSSSLDATFVNETEFGAYTGSNNLRVSALEIESGSIRTDFNSFTSSYTTGSFTGSFIGDGSGLIGVTASYYVETDPIFTAKSGSFATTGSNTFAGIQIINGDVTINGTASIDYLHVTYESASVIYSSGSNQLGDDVTDTQTIIGITTISGSLSVTGSVNIPSLTGSLQGTATNALTASYIQGVNVDGAVTLATTASYIIGSNVDGAVTNATNAVTASYILASGIDGTVATATSSSYAITASYALNVPATASYSLIAETASYVQGSNVDGSVSNASTASYIENAQTASYVETSQTASYVLGSSVDGQVSSALSSSYAATASYINGSLVKSGQIDGTTFTGNPKTGTITFTTPFPDNNYSITITGEDIRTWTVESKVSGSFVINSNSNPALVGNVFWQAINFGEHNY